MDRGRKVHRPPARFEDNGCVIPFEKVPGLPPLFRAFLKGEAGEFFPDEPSTAAVGARSKQIPQAGQRPASIPTWEPAGSLAGPPPPLSKALATHRRAR